MLSKVLKAAQMAASRGFSPVPVKDDGSKKPTRPWKEFQTRIASLEELEEMFSNGAILGIACGAASGNLEVLDFDEPGFYERWAESVPRDLLARLLLTQTPSGGKHVYYRIQGAVPGNRVLARTSGGSTAIETRGHGGYVVCVPSPGYKAVQGKFSEIATLTSEEHESLITSARRLNEVPEVVDPYRGNPSLQRPGDLYAAVTSWAAFLEPLGWLRVGQQGENTLWRRPDKTDGHSATTNGEDGYFYCHTSNAEHFEGGRAYTKFSAFCAVNSHGDPFIGAQMLRAKGFGAVANETRKEQMASAALDRSWGSLSGTGIEEIGWFWEPYIPAGLLTLVYGDGGVGKSTAMLALASALSVGGKLPSGTVLTAGNTIILSAEDPPAQVIVPRLMGMGADLSRIFVPNEFEDDGAPNPMILDDTGCSDLAAKVEELDVRFVIVDPVLAYFEAMLDMNRGTDVRHWMRRLANVARHTGAAIVLVHHVNKNAQQKAQHRAMGSGDFVNAARSALMAIQDPEDETNCAFHHTKHNLSAKGPTVGFTVEAGQFRWTGLSDLTPEACSVPPKCNVSPKQKDKARAYLVRLIEEEVIWASNDSIGSNEVIAMGKEEGISREALFEAKGSIPGLKAQKVGQKGRWVWRLEESSRY